MSSSNLEPAKTIKVRTISEWMIKRGMSRPLSGARLSLAARGSRVMRANNGPWRDNDVDGICLRRRRPLPFFGDLLFHPI